MMYPVTIPAGVATIDSITSWIKKVANNFTQDDIIGGDQSIVQSERVEWLRGDKPKWSANKWTVFARAGQSLWLLTLWRAELIAEDVEVEYASMGPATINLGDLKEQVTPGPEYAAALRRLQGADLATVAAAYGISEDLVDKTTMAMLGASPDEFDQAVRHGILAELSALREKVDAIQPMHPAGNGHGAAAVSQPLTNIVQATAAQMEAIEKRKTVPTSQRAPRKRTEGAG
jgi:hypothetical protein